MNPNEIHVEHYSVKDDIRIIITSRVCVCVPIAFEVVLREGKLIYKRIPVNIVKNIKVDAFANVHMTS